MTQGVSRALRIVLLVVLYAVAAACAEPHIVESDGDGSGAPVGDTARLQPRSSPSGPLRPLAGNPRYFADATGRAVYLTGSHHWDNLMDNTGPSGTFDYDAYLDLLEQHHHNFIRMWSQPAWFIRLGIQETCDRCRMLPSLYVRTGPGEALDGGPKFDVTKLNPEYFERLRSRVIEAGERGMYVAIMLFQGWSIEKKVRHDPWYLHPFNRENNINGIDGDPEERGRGRQLQTLDLPEITELQEAYVRAVIDAVHDLDNVLYEISNEGPAASMAWQEHMIRVIKEYEAKKPKQHPVGLTSPWQQKNAALFEGDADWISPNRHSDDYRDNPPPAPGQKVVISDTDHLWGIGGDPTWVWKTFLRGHHPIYMDPLTDEPAHVAARVAMGRTRLVAEAIDLTDMVPRPALASTRYCLVATGADARLLVYLPDGGAVTVDLTGKAGSFSIEWLDPRTGEVAEGGEINGGARRTLTAPFTGPAVVFLTSGDRSIRSVEPSGTP